MRQKSKMTNATRSPARLYRSAKISRYQFERVLWAFVKDESAAKAASHIALSANSIAGIYAKLRTFFFEHGLFVDVYEGRDVSEEAGGPGDEAEYRTIEYHLARVAKKRGQIDEPLRGPAYHFAESCWRLRFEAVKLERASAMVERMMFDHLMEFIRQFGPVGSPVKPPPTKRKEAGRLALEQIDRIALWLERNSVEFRNPVSRAKLRDIREDG